MNILRLVSLQSELSYRSLAKNGIEKKNKKDVRHTTEK